MPTALASIAESRGKPPMPVGNLPWYCYAVVFGATSIAIGIIWDISWHSTIGRDTFWTPAHMAIYLGGVLGGCCCGWLILKTTFRGDAMERATSVRIWGLRGPLGAWVAVWGALAMLTSAPFDDWWHNTYGLDVKILSPPHAVLAFGMHHVVVGALLLVLSWQNRGTGRQQSNGSGLFVYAGGVMLVMASVLVMEYSFPNQQHAGIFYKVCCALYPVILVAVTRASKWPWPATTAAAVFMLLKLAMVWILPLFAATPKLAPIYNPVDHMVPPPFPILLIVPAIGIDLLLRRLGPGRWRDWLTAPLAAAVFLGLFLLVQWHFSKFLISPAAQNWVFAGDRIWSYGASPGHWRMQFWHLDEDPVNLRSLGLAFVIAAVSARIGLLWGNWMSAVKR